MQKIKEPPAGYCTAANDESRIPIPPRVRRLVTQGEVPRLRAKRGSCKTFVLHSTALCCCFAINEECAVFYRLETVSYRSEYIAFSSSGLLSQGRKGAGGREGEMAIRRGGDVYARCFDDDRKRHARRALGGQAKGPRGSRRQFHSAPRFRRPPPASRPRTAAKIFRWRFPDRRRWRSHPPPPAPRRGDTAADSDASARRRSITPWSATPTSRASSRLRGIDGATRAVTPCVLDGSAAQQQRSGAGASLSRASTRRRACDSGPATNEGRAPGNDGEERSAESHESRSHPRHGQGKPAERNG